MPLVLVSKDSAVGTISLNRPEKKNALTDELVKELLDAFVVHEGDSEVNVIVLQAEGSDFCAGFDLRQSSYAKVEQPLSFYIWMMRNMRATYQAIWNCRKPVIAKCQGYTIAGGCYLQMLCDITIVAEDAKLGHPAVMSGGVSAMPLWNWYLGVRKAKEMLLTGKIIDGREAERIGLVNSAVHPGMLDMKVAELAAHMATMPPDAAALCKEGLNTAADIMGLSATFRTQSEVAALSRYGETNFDLADMQRNAAKA